MESLADELARFGGQMVDADGIGTHYVECGKGDPVVLIHGGGPGADGFGNWHSCLPRFGDWFRAIAVDMLGFGRTDKPDPQSFTYSQEARTTHLIHFIEGLGVGPVSLVGNSMGGITSLGIAARRPDLVKKLVLMGSAGIKTAGVPPALAPLMQYDGTTVGMRKVIRALTHPRFQMEERSTGSTSRTGPERGRRAPLRSSGCATKAGSISRRTSSAG